MHHVVGHVDPVRDIEVINTELMLADLDSVKKRRERVAKDVKRGDKAAAAEDAVLDEDRGGARRRQARADRGADAEERALARRRSSCSPTSRRSSRATSRTPTWRRPTPIPYVRKVRDYVGTHLACEAVVISAQIESDLVDLAPGRGAGVPEGAGRGGERHRRADPRRPTTCSACGPTSRPARRKCARGRSTPATPRPRPRASSTPTSSAASSRPKPWPTTIWCAAARSPPRARRALYRMEGKEYVVADGDVLLFKFNV